MNIATLYIGIILVCRVVQAIFSKQSSNEVRSAQTLMVYSSYRMALSALLGVILLLVGLAGGEAIRIDGLTVLIATFSGLMLFVASACSLYCMKSGTVSLDSMFGTAGMLIPLLAGIFLFDQPVRPLQWVAVAVFFVSAWLLVQSSRKTYSNFSFKTALLLLGSLLSNGATMLAQQLFTEYVPNGSVSAFSFVSFAVLAVLCGATALGMWICDRRKASGETAVRSAAANYKLSRNLLLCGAALAVAVFVINQLATLSTALVSPVILFAFINGGGTIIATVVAAILYKEKLSVTSTLGVLLGIASLVMIKVFEA